MRTKDKIRNTGKSGVALVIVLGLLSVLTTLAVAFAIAMRVESMAAQNFANGIRAEHLVQAGITRAMEKINDNMVNPRPVAYPRWTDAGGQLVEALVSTGGTVRCADILTTEAEKSIPRYLLGDAQDRSADCVWENIRDAAGRTNRIAYLFVNKSGLLDANNIGGTNRVWSENLREIDIHAIPGISNTNDFFASRRVDRRYETVPELLKLNAGLEPDIVEDLDVYSYDPGRDMTFTNKLLRRTRLGLATTNDLKLKFNVNALTNWPASTYITPAFKTAYKDPLIQLLRDAGRVYKPEDVVWNIVNWIDSDRYPQNEPGGRPAYVSTEGGEALPVISEIALQPVITVTSNFVPNPRAPGGGSWVTSSATSSCAFAVEIWYPFVVENETWTDGGYAKYSLTIDTIPTNGTISFDIDPMAYGTPTEFRVYTSSVIPQLTAQVRAVVFEGSKDDPNRLPVDASMDRRNSGSATDTWQQWVVHTPFNNFLSMEVDDPRSNGKPEYWKPCLSSNTLGRMNTISDPWGTAWPGTYDRQGLPIYVKNGPMENIGEMGYIPLANRENHSPALPPVKHYWCTIDLLNRDEGAYFLDYMTVYPTNRFGNGYVTINTRDQETLKALFTEMWIGWTNYFEYLKVEDAAVNSLIDTVTRKIIERTESFVMPGETEPRGAISFADLFDGADTQGGEVANAFRAIGDWWATQTGHKVNDKVREDGFRNIIELITFRQNLFTLVVAAQVMAPNGRTVEAEKRALATIYRDSFTGNYFVRSFKWMK